MNSTITIDGTAYRRIRPEHSAGVELYTIQDNRLASVGTVERCVTATQLGAAANSRPKVLMADGRTVRLPKHGAWRKA